MFKNKTIDVILKLKKCESFIWRQLMSTPPPPPSKKNEESPIAAPDTPNPLSAINLAPKPEGKVADNDEDEDKAQSVQEKAAPNPNATPSQGAEEKQKAFKNDTFNWDATVQNYSKHFQTEYNIINLGKKMLGGLSELASKGFESIRAAFSSPGDTPNGASPEQILPSGGADSGGGGHSGGEPSLGKAAVDSGAADAVVPGAKAADEMTGGKVSSAIDDQIGSKLKL